MKGTVAVVVKEKLTKGGRNMKERFTNVDENLQAGEILGKKIPLSIPSWV